MVIRRLWHEQTKACAAAPRDLRTNAFHDRPPVPTPPEPRGEFYTEETAIRAGFSKALASLDGMRDRPPTATAPEPLPIEVNGVLFAPTCGICGVEFAKPGGGCARYLGYNADGVMVWRCFECDPRRLRVQKETARADAPVLDRRYFPGDGTAPDCRCSVTPIPAEPEPKTILAPFAIDAPPRCRWAEPEVVERVRWNERMLGLIAERDDCGGTEWEAAEQAHLEDVKVALRRGHRIKREWPLCPAGGEVELYAIERDGGTLVVFGCDKCEEKDA